MNKYSKLGYEQGYLSKNAGFWDAAGGAVGSLTNLGALGLAAAPAIAGGVGGYIAANASSPTKEDEEVLQKKLKSSELNEFLATLQKRREREMMLAKLKQLVQGGKGERSLHI